jgi:hypothetical protein
MQGIREETGAQVYVCLLVSLPLLIKRPGFYMGVSPWQTYLTLTASQRLFLSSGVGFKFYPLDTHSGIKWQYAFLEDKPYPHHSATYALSRWQMVNFRSVGRAGFWGAIPFCLF